MPNYEAFVPFLTIPCSPDTCHEDGLCDICLTHSDDMVLIFEVINIALVFVEEGEQEALAYCYHTLPEADAYACSSDRD